MATPASWAAPTAATQLRKTPARTTSPMTTICSATCGADRAPASGRFMSSTATSSTSPTTGWLPPTGPLCESKGARFHSVSPAGQTDADFGPVTTVLSSSTSAGYVDLVDSLSDGTSGPNHLTTQGVVLSLPYQYMHRLVVDCPRGRPRMRGPRPHRRPLRQQLKQSPGTPSLQRIFRLESCRKQSRTYPRSRGGENGTREELWLPGSRQRCPHDAGRNLPSDLARRARRAARGCADRDVRRHRGDRARRRGQRLRARGGSGRRALHHARQRRLPA